MPMKNVSSVLIILAVVSGTLAAPIFWYLADKVTRAPAKPLPEKGIDVPINVHGVIHYLTKMDANLFSVTGWILGAAAVVTVTYVLLTRSKTK